MVKILINLEKKFIVVYQYFVLFNDDEFSATKSFYIYACFIGIYFMIFKRSENIL